MKRRFLLVTLAAASAAAGALQLGSREASAVTPAQVVGAYRIKLKGEGWLRGKSSPYRAERIDGSAVLLLVRDTADSEKLKVEIRLDPSLAGGLADLATPEPAFAGAGYVIGDSLSVIDTGAPTYVNAFVLTFLKDGDKVAGHWMSVFPSTDPASGAASGLAIDFAGRRTKVRTLPVR